MTQPENPYTGGEQPAQPITPPADPYGLNPNANPNPYTQPQEPAQPYVQNAAPEQGREAYGNSNYGHAESAPQFTGNEPAQQPYGTPYEPVGTQPTTQINYGAPQYGEQPAYGAPTGGAPVYGEPGGPAYGGPAQFPPQGGYDQYPPQGPPDKYNTMAIVGLILAILFPLIGLIVSIIAMVNINKHGGSKASKNLSRRSHHGLHHRVDHRVQQCSGGDERDRQRFEVAERHAFADPEHHGPRRRH